MRPAPKSKGRAEAKLQLYSSLSVCALLFFLWWTLVSHRRRVDAAPFRGPAVTHAVLARRAREAREAEAEAASCIEGACPQTLCTIACSADGCLSLTVERGAFLADLHRSCEIEEEDEPPAFPRRCQLLLQAEKSCADAAASCQLANSTLACDQQHRPSAEAIDSVPPILHLVFPGDAGEQWPFWAHLHLTTAAAVLRPETILFHHPEDALPAGHWWEASLPMLTLAPQPRVTRVYSAPVLLKAHQSDVMRLSALIRHGGLYLDSDVLVLRSFEPLTHSAPFTIGVQSPGRTANAVLLSSRANPFVRRWADAYHTFNGSRDWDAHSVRTPWRLAEEHPGLVSWLPRTAFFSPGPDDDPGYQLFQRNWSEAAFSRLPEAYAHHLWHTLTAAQLGEVTGPAWVWAHSETLYARCVLRLAEGHPSVARLLVAQRD